MAPITYVAYFLTGVAAGTLGGFMGIGGGIILIPLLTFLFAYDQRSAQGMSLAVLLLPIGFLSFWQYWKNPAVHSPGMAQLSLAAAAVIALGFFFGGYLGGKGANAIPDVNVLRKCFAVFLACVSVYLFFFKR
jgi:uncharacterized membrane protein YfcA